MKNRISLRNLIRPPRPPPNSLRRSPPGSYNKNERRNQISQKMLNLSRKFQIFLFSRTATPNRELRNFSENLDNFRTLKVFVNFSPGRWIRQFWETQGRKIEMKFNFPSSPMETKEICRPNRWDDIWTTGDPIEDLEKRIVFFGENFEFLNIFFFVFLLVYLLLVGVNRVVMEELRSEVMGPNGPEYLNNNFFF